LPERERLLLAMADVTPDLRDEVERLAKEKDMPLAPLYGALISSDAKDLTLEQRIRKLAEAADAFITTRNQMRTLASTDPAVTKLRQEAEQQLALGAFDTARGKLTEAAAIDSTSRSALKANFIERTLSEASTHAISGGASRADLNYDLAIASYEQAAVFYNEVAFEKLPDEQRERQLQTLDGLGDLYVTVGDLAKARNAFEAGQAIATKLTEAEPENRGWKDKLALSTLKLGDVLRDQGDSKSALSAYESGLGLRKDHATNPSDAAARGLEAAAYLKVGALHKLQAILTRRSPPMKPAAILSRRWS
jgi:tetratricopeptide (TPR) repeat protein